MTRAKGGHQTAHGTCRTLLWLLELCEAKDSIHSSPLWQNLAVITHVLLLGYFLAIFCAAFVYRTTRMFSICVAMWVSLAAGHNLAKGGHGPPLCSVIAGCVGTWYMLEIVVLEKHALFKTYRRSYHVLGLSFVLFTGYFLTRCELEVSTTGELLIGYLLGLFSASLVFGFIFRTSLRDAHQMKGLYPLWIKLGLKDNLVSSVKGGFTKSQRDLFNGLKIKHEPVKEARDRLHNTLIDLQKATANLTSASNTQYFSHWLLSLLLFCATIHCPA